MHHLMIGMYAAKYIQWVILSCANKQTKPYIVHVNHKIWSLDAIRRQNKHKAYEATVIVT